MCLRSEWSASLHGEKRSVCMAKGRNENHRSQKRRPSEWKRSLFSSLALNCLQLSIVKKETGTLTEVITQENFRSIIPSANNLRDAIDYLQGYTEQIKVFSPLTI